MPENGETLKKAIVERVNGILKDEYLETYDVDNIKEAKELLKTVIGFCNGERPQMSIGNFTSNQVHLSIKRIKTKKLWKNYYRKQTTFLNPFKD